MRQTRCTRTLVAGVATALLAAALPVAALASYGGAHHSAHAQAALNRPLFAFGREGGNIRPLTITITTTGLVKGAMNGARMQLSPAALNGLMTLARAEGFFSLPATIVGHGLPDIAGRYITITTASGAKSVHVRFAHNAAFDQLYAVLSAVAGEAS